MLSASYPAFSDGEWKTIACEMGDRSHGDLECMNRMGRGVSNSARRPAAGLLMAGRREKSREEQQGKAKIVLERG